MFVVVGGTNVANVCGVRWDKLYRHQCRNLHHVYMRRKRNRPRFGFVPVLCKRGLSLSLSTPTKLKNIPDHCWNRTNVQRSLVGRALPGGIPKIVGSTPALFKFKYKRARWGYETQRNNANIIFR